MALAAGYSDRLIVPGRFYFLDVPFDPVEFVYLVENISKINSMDSYRYIVTPNVDHVVRLMRDVNLRKYYENAWLSLCDSSPVSMLAKLISVRLPIVTGSDLTEIMFQRVIQDFDQITLIVANEDVASRMRCTYPNVRFHCHVPPGNLMSSPDAIEECVRFAASRQSRFIFIAVGSPQSERIAFELAKHPNASGLALCCGASIEFLVGTQVRAPDHLRQSGFEWLYRLLQDPKRLWRRYLFSVPPLIKLFTAEVVSRIQHEHR
jgi:exopolysaccharide biosynthesis WecB/TagA/CpsF family protein